MGTDKKACTQVFPLLDFWQPGKTHFFYFQQKEVWSKRLLNRYLVSWLGHMHWLWSRDCWCAVRMSSAVRHLQCSVLEYFPNLEGSRKSSHTDPKYLTQSKYKIAQLSSGSVHLSCALLSRPLNKGVRNRLFFSMVHGWEGVSGVGLSLKPLKRAWAYAKCAFADRCLSIHWKAQRN